MNKTWPHEGPTWYLRHMNTNIGSAAKSLKKTSDDQDEYEDMILLVCQSDSDFEWL